MMKKNGNGGKCIRANLVWVLGILIGLILVEVWGGYQLYSRGFWARIIRVESLQSITPTKPQARAYFREKIKAESWVSSRDPLIQYQGALRWIMNRVRKVASNPNSDPVALLQSMEAGDGALCDNMADLYQNVLAVIGKPSRKIWLFRDPLIRYDTHAEVEVRVNGKWVIMSPTFGVSFRNPAGELLSAQDLKAYFLKGRTGEVKPDFYGEVAYPARLEKYYLNYSVFYNNVFVVEPRQVLLGLVPPFCYWFGAKLYYEKLPYESDSHIQFIQQLYIIFALLIPGLCLVFVVYGIFLLLRGLNMSLFSFRLDWVRKQNNEVQTK